METNLQKVNEILEELANDVEYIQMALKFKNYKKETIISILDLGTERLRDDLIILEELAEVLLFQRLRFYNLN